MTQPIRLQLRRVKGFNLQALSLSLNGLPAVNVARPSKWGNPYRVAPAYNGPYLTIPAITPEIAVHLFRERWLNTLAHQPHHRAALDPLRHHNLACYCAPGAPCHADVLLELANA